MPLGSRLRALALACLLAFGAGSALAHEQQATSANLSSTIATGGTFQSLQGANIGRIGCLIQNPTTATEPLYVNVGSASPSTGNSFSLAAGASFNCSVAGVVITDAIQVEAATTGHAFIAVLQ